MSLLRVIHLLFIFLARFLILRCLLGSTWLGRFFCVSRDAVRHVDISSMRQVRWFLGWTFVVEPDAEFAFHTYTSNLHVFYIFFAVASQLIPLILQLTRFFGDFIHLSNKSFEEVFLVHIDSWPNFLAIDEFVDLLSGVVISSSLLWVGPRLWLDYNTLFLLFFLRFWLAP